MVFWVSRDRISNQILDPARIWPQNSTFLCFEGSNLIFLKYLYEVGQNFDKTIVSFLSWMDKFLVKKKHTIPTKKESSVLLFEKKIEYFLLEKKTKPFYWRNWKDNLRKEWNSFHSQKGWRGNFFYFLREKNKALLTVECFLLYFQNIRFSSFKKWNNYLIDWTMFFSFRRL